MTVSPNFVRFVSFVVKYDTLSLIYFPHSWLKKPLLSISAK